MDKYAKKAFLKARRQKRVRSKISGTAERPRMCVSRSTRHVYVQVIDDVAGKTLVAINSYKGTERANSKVCKELGTNIAEKCKEKNITQVVFDKSGYVYHGRIAAVAEGAREGGLKF
jgi:large subunit ribosomal protein L18